MVLRKLFQLTVFLCMANTSGMTEPASSVIRGNVLAWASTPWGRGETLSAQEREWLTHRTAELLVPLVTEPNERDFAWLPDFIRACSRRSCAEKKGIVERVLACQAIDVPGLDVSQRAWVLCIIVNTRNVNTWHIEQDLRLPHSFGGDGLVWPRIKALAGYNNSAILRKLVARHERRM